MSKALDRQVSGNHYRDFAIQPIEYIQANGFDFITGNIIKYASRHRAKNGAEDVKKIIHYCELLLELEYGVESGEPALPADYKDPEPISPKERARLVAEFEKIKIG